MFDCSSLERETRERKTLERKKKKSKKINLTIAPLNHAGGVMCLEMFADRLLRGPMRPAWRLLSDRGGWFRWQEATFNAKTPQMTSTCDSASSPLRNPTRTTSHLRLCGFQAEIIFQKLPGHPQETVSPLFPCLNRHSVPNTTEPHSTTCNTARWLPKPAVRLITASPPYKPRKCH